MLNAVQVNLGVLNLNDEKVYRICEDNRDLRLEKNAHGDLEFI